MTVSLVITYGFGDVMVPGVPNLIGVPDGDAVGVGGGGVGVMGGGVGVIGGGVGLGDEVSTKTTGFEFAF
jgi:hypothetical protein